MTIPLKEPIRIQKLYRHKHSGNVYRVMGTARLQMDGPADNISVVIYREGHQPMWVRPETEFRERFEGPV